MRYFDKDFLQRLAPSLWRSSSLARSGDGACPAAGLITRLMDAHHGSNAADSAAIALLAKSQGLTPRQAEVLHWIAEGKTNDEIATILACSFHTVKTHLKQIFQRLGVHTRTGAAAVAYRALIQRQLQAAASPERAIPLQKKSG